jgi:hypothetical protein
MAAPRPKASAILCVGQSLVYNTPNDRLTSPNGDYSLIMGDGQIYIVDNARPDNKLWVKGVDSSTEQTTLEVYKNALQLNNWLLSFFPKKQSIFGEAFFGSREVEFLAMQDDGNLVLYGRFGSAKQYIFWSSNSVQPGKHSQPQTMYKIYENTLKPAPESAAPVSAPGLLFARIVRQEAAKPVGGAGSAAASAATPVREEGIAAAPPSASPSPPAMTAQQRRAAYNASLLANLESQQATIHHNLEAGTQKVNEEQRESERGAAAAAASAKPKTPLEILQQKRLIREYTEAKFQYTDAKDTYDQALLKQKITSAIESAPPFSIEMFYLRKIMEEGSAGGGRVNEVYRQIAPYVSILPVASKCGNRLKRTLREYLSNAAAEAAVPLPEPFAILTRESTQLLYTHFSIAENQLQQIFQQTIGLLTDNDEIDLAIELIMCSLQSTDYLQLTEYYRKANRGEVPHIPLLRPLAAAALPEPSILGGARPRRFTRRYMKNK